MSDLLNFPAEALAVPAAEIRMLADPFASLQIACSHAASMLIERLDHHDGDPDLEDDDPAEDNGDREREH